MNYTTIEQGKELLALGLKPETADMFWINAALDNIKQATSPLIIDKCNENHIPILECDIPCWSGLQLIKLMPKYIDEFKLIISSNEISYYSEENLDPYLYCFADDDLIIAILEMVKTLLKNEQICNNKVL